MRRLLLIGILVAVGAAGIAARQPAGGPPQVAELVKVKDNLFIVKGGGGNTAVFVTATGITLVDTKLAGWGERIMQQVRPLIDTNNGGSGVAYPATLTKAATGISGVDTVIPGHADVMPWAKFVEFGEFNAAFLAAVQQAVKDGKTPEDAFTSLKLPETFKAYTMGRGQANVTAIYAELKK